MHSIVDIFDRGLSGTVYLTSLDKEENYRYKLATIRPYKGNRKQEKPRWFQEARDYLCYAWGAQIVKGMEADDAISIEQWRNKDRQTCIVSIDKDLRNTPGFHYDWRKGLHYYITLLEANRHFYMQMLTGDTTDNIGGVPNVGKVKAQRLLGECTSEAEMRQVVEQQYKACKWENIEWQEAMKECGNLLWMQREPNVLWAS